MRTKTNGWKYILFGCLAAGAGVVAWFFIKKKKAAATTSEVVASSSTSDTSAVPTKAIGYRINNPLNLRYSAANNWKGQQGQQSGFCVFDTPENGIRAAMINLKSYRKKGVVTIADIISRWAPPSENNTEAYIDFVCNKLGANRTDEVEQSAEDYIALLQAMCVMEIGCQPYSADQWAKAAQLAIL